MSFESDIFRKKRVVFERLVPFGFRNHRVVMSSAKTILDGAFEVRVHVVADGEASTHVIDTDLNEEYLAIHVAQAWEFCWASQRSLSCGA